jgi:hypothetical protein
MNASFFHTGLFIASQLGAPANMSNVDIDVILTEKEEGKDDTPAS